MDVRATARDGYARAFYQRAGRLKAMNGNEGRIAREGFAAQSEAVAVRLETERNDDSKWLARDIRTTLRNLQR
jgi:hypothetical protein